MSNLRRVLLTGLVAVASARGAAAQGPGPSSTQGPQFLLRASAADAAIVAARHNLSIVGQVDNGTGAITFLADRKSVV